MCTTVPHQTARNNSVAKQIQSHNVNSKNRYFTGKHTLLGVPVCNSPPEFLSQPMSDLTFETHLLKHLRQEAHEGGCKLLHAQLTGQFIQICFIALPRNYCIAFSLCLPPSPPPPPLPPFSLWYTKDEIYDSVAGSL